MESTSSCRDWAWLPAHILDSVLGNLVSLVDFLRFGAVCKPWNAVTKHNTRQRHIFNASQPQLPLLMIPTHDNSHERRSLYSITQDKVYDFQVKVPYTQRCCGSSHGWSITVDGTIRLTLLNPFSNISITLPPILMDNLPVIDYEDDPYLFIVKATLSADPVVCPSDYEVAVLYDGMHLLAIYKSRDKAWTYFHNHPNISFFQDFIYYKGKLHLIDYWMGIKKVDDSKALVPQLTDVAPSILPAYPIYSEYSTYIVEASNGALLLIRRFFGEEKFEDVEHIDDGFITELTSKFRIFEYFPSNGECDKASNAVEIKDLGNHAIFLGDNSSMMVSTCDFPLLQSNCIYFTDNYIDNCYYGFKDVGIFNLEDGSIKEFNVPCVADRNDRQEGQQHLPSVTWLVPTLQQA